MIPGNKRTGAPQSQPSGEPSAASRRSFLRKGALLGGGIAGIGTLLNFIPPAARAKDSDRGSHGDDNRGNECIDNNSAGDKKGDTDILIAAEIAEALAVTTYTNIINTSPFFGRLPSDDQGYLAAARQEEMSHYALEQSVTTQPSPFTAFFYPSDMFADPQTTLNILVTLEDAFIAAYLIGVRDLSTDSLKELAAQILGIECEHRALARIIAADLNLPGTKGLSGVNEPSTGAGRAPNNLAFERTFSGTLKTIGDVVTALGPFITPGASGFDTTKFSFDTTANFYVTETPTVTLDDTTP